MKDLFDRIAQTLFFLTAMCLLIGYGLLAAYLQIFPAPQAQKIFRDVSLVYAQFFKPDLKMIAPEDVNLLTATRPEAASSGLVMVTAVDENNRNFIGIIDRSGQIIHEYRPDWFADIENHEFIPEQYRPKRQPGASIHGVQVLPDGSALLNFTTLGTARYDACGRKLWFLENFGHHSISPSNDGHFWVPSEVNPFTRQPDRIPNHQLTTKDATVQKITVEGEILEEINVLDILWKNDLMGVIYASAHGHSSPVVGGDTMHLNDAEEFPDDMEPGVFEPGDLMLSLRNPNTIIVVDRATLEVKHMIFGRMLRQHDPDFISGNEVLIFDNRNFYPAGHDGELRSRILLHDARTRSEKVVYQTEERWFTRYYGAHDVTANGNLLVAASLEGQVLELTPDGEIAWVWANERSDGGRVLITATEELPLDMDADFFVEKRAACGG